MNKMTSPKKVKAAQRYWAGESLHPFVERVHALFLERGFRFHSQEDGQFYTWKKEIFEGYDYGISIGATGARPSGDGCVGVNVGIFVDSKRQAAVEKELNLAECVMLDPYSVSLPVDEVTLIYVPLSWLIGRLDEGHSSLDWHSIDRNSADEVADDVIKSLDVCGASFLNLIQSPAKLARLLHDIEAFPGAGPLGAGGPVSVSPEIYAAVIFFGESDWRNAMRSLEKMWGKWRLKYNGDELGLAIARCKIEKYSAWISKSASIS